MSAAARRDRISAEKAALAGAAGGELSQVDWGPAPACARAGSPDLVVALGFGAGGTGTSAAAICSRAPGKWAPLLLVVGFDSKLLPACLLRLRQEEAKARGGHVGRGGKKKDWDAQLLRHAVPVSVSHSQRSKEARARVSCLNLGIRKFSNCKPLYL